MKMLKSKKSLYLTIVIIALAILLIALLWSIIAHMAHKEKGSKSLSELGASTGIYETRSLLLMEAMDSVGACTPEEAAYTWAKGLKMRSGAMQYSAMTRILKNTYAADLQYTFPNWVTGMSSPWIDSYEITAVNEPQNKHCVMELHFLTATSAGPADELSARVTMELDGHFWRIESIVMDEELLPYTGFSENP